ncbi:hypothetical protein R50073_13310 [Maricurvus nonylphenolicus]|uniref:cytochrome b n=1 Tax=Maricurvus nonylphenolicus TaxID=1008307 RepID=UPI0036F40F66
MFEAINISLFLLAFTCVIVLALNFQQPVVRAAAIVLGALGCLAIVYGFFFLTESKILDEPRETQLITDYIKPVLLYLQAIMLTAMAGVLLFVAYRLFNQGNQIEVRLKNTDQSYGSVSRSLHWMVAILFVVVVPTATYMTIIPEDVWYRKNYYVLHKNLGFVLMSVVLVRLVWKRYDRPVMPHPSLNTGEKTLVNWVHRLLYMVMFLFPVTGYGMSTSGGKSSEFFGAEVPLLWSPNETLTLVFALFHKIVIPYVLYIAITLHLAGALKHLLQENK